MAQTHSFYLTQNEQTFKLHDAIDNLNGKKRIRVNKITLYVGFFNISNATGIEWETLVEGSPAERTEFNEEALNNIKNQFLQAWEQS